MVRIMNFTQEGKKGLIIVNTGDGKGKTTAALGTALRTLGWGGKVLLVQFMKGDRTTGEIKFLSKFETQFKTLSASCPFSWNTKNKEKDIEICKEVWDNAKEFILNGGYDLIILDEINIVTSLGYLVETEIINVLKKKKSSVNIILTGRNAGHSLLDFADLVTEMKNIKHPFDQGILAKKGIDF